MFTTTKRKVAVIIAGAALFGGACNTGFQKITERFSDAPRGEVNKGPADIITMPDGFSNVSAKCDGANRVYVVFHSNSAYGSVAVAPNDPRCRQ